MKDRKFLVLSSIILLAVMLVGTLFTGGCAKQATSPIPEAKTLKLGFICDLSLPLGRDYQRMLESLVSAVNDEGGLAIGGDRYKIDLIVYDSKFSPETGRAAVERLVFQDKVNFLLGDVTVDAWFPVTEENKVVSVVFSVSPACLSPDLKYTFQGSFLNTAVTVNWVWFTANYPELKTIGAMLPDDMNGHMDAQALKQICSASGLTLVDAIFYQRDTMDLSALATKIKTSNPQVYTTAGSGPPQDALSWKALRESGYKGLLFNYRGIDPDVWGKIIDMNMLEGSIYVVGDIDVEPPLSSVAKEAKDAYIAKYGSWDDPACPFIGNWYLLKTALESAQSIDPDKVAAAIGSGLKFDTPFAPAMMISRPDRDNSRTIDAVYGTNIATWEEGKVKIVHTISPEEAFEYIKKSGVFGVYPD